MDEAGTAVRATKEALLEAMAEVALGGHDLGEWEEVENGWQSTCNLCKCITWINHKGMRYSLLSAICEHQSDCDDD